MRFYAKKHGLDYETSDWIGQYLFGLKDRAIPKLLPCVKEKNPYIDGTLDVNSDTCIKNIDIWDTFNMILAI